MLTLVCEQSAGRGLRYVAFRWFFTERRMQHTDKNGVRFRYWIKALKEGRSEAVHLFSGVLLQLLSEHLPDVDAVIPVPPHDPSKIDFPLAQVAGNTALPGVGWLKRVTAVTPWTGEATRSVNEQRESLYFEPPGGVRKDRILIVDDVWTSGATLRASTLLIRDAWPDCKVTCFAFGRAVIRGQNAPAFPSDPKFGAPPGISEIDAG